MNLNNFDVTITQDDMSREIGLKIMLIGLNVLVFKKLNFTCKGAVALSGFEKPDAVKTLLEAREGNCSV